MPAIPALGRWKQMFTVILGYVVRSYREHVRPCLRKRKKERKRGKESKRLARSLGTLKVDL